MYSTAFPKKVGVFDHRHSAEYAQSYMDRLKLDKDQQRRVAQQLDGLNLRYQYTSTDIARHNHAAGMRLASLGLVHSMRGFAMTMAEYNAATTTGSNWHIEVDRFGIPENVVSGSSSATTECVVGRVDFTELAKKVVAEGLPPLVSVVLEKYGPESNELIQQAVEAGDARHIGGSLDEESLEAGCMYNMTGLIHRARQNVPEDDMHTARSFLYTLDSVGSDF